MKVTIRQAKPDECNVFYALMHSDMTWKTLDAPYFPYQQPALDDFRTGYFQTLCDGQSRRVIDVDGEIVGTVCFYWACEVTRWLEVGIVIYNPDYWGKGIGLKALSQWITEVFVIQKVVRVGLTIVALQIIRYKARR